MNDTRSKKERIAEAGARALAEAEARREAAGETERPNELVHVAGGKPGSGTPVTDLNGSIYKNLALPTVRESELTMSHYPSATSSCHRTDLSMVHLGQLIIAKSSRVFMSRFIMI